MPVLLQVYPKMVYSIGLHRHCYRFQRRIDFTRKKRGTPLGKPIIYCVMDATDETSLLSLGDQHFDHLVCTMAFMDIPDLNLFFREAQKLLKLNESFMFATAHPAFFSNNPSFISKKNEVDGKTIITHALKITNYLSLPPMKGVGAPNEPAPHVYYHRPLHELLGVAFQLIINLLKAKMSYILLRLLSQ